MLKREYVNSNLFYTAIVIAYVMLMYNVIISVIISIIFITIIIIIIYSTSSFNVNELFCKYNRFLCCSLWLTISFIIHNFLLSCREQFTPLNSFFLYVGKVCSYILIQMWWKYLHNQFGVLFIRSPKSELKSEALSEFFTEFLYERKFLFGWENKSIRGKTCLRILTFSQEFCYFLFL